MLAFERTTALRLTLYVVLVLLFANLGALIDLAFHPEVPYFDGEHLVEGAITALAMVVLLTALEVYLRQRRRAEAALGESEARYRGYFEQTLVGVIVASPDRRLVEVNQAACDLLGYDRDELLRLTWPDLTHPDDLTADRARNQRLVAGEASSTRFEKRFMRRDGEVVHADMSLSCRRRPDGTVDSFVALISDVTDQRRSAQESALLKHSIDVHRDGAFWMGTDNTFVYVNEAACAMLGYARGELIGQHLSLVSPEATPERLVRIWERLRTEGSFTDETCLLYTSDAADE